MAGPPEVPKDICKTCRFWEKGRGLTASKCHRYPPTMLALGSTLYPTTKENDWCGEHESASNPSAP